MTTHLTESATVKAQLLELGRQADILRHLPSDHVEFAHQEEVPTAYPKAMLFGKTTGKPARVWIYWSKSWQKLMFHSFYNNDTADEWFTAERVVKLATPSHPFRFVTCESDLCVLATYYFLRAGLGTRKVLRFLPHQLDALLTMSTNFAEEGNGDKKSKIVKLRVHLSPHRTHLPIVPPRLITPVSTGSDQHSAFLSSRAGYDIPQKATKRVPASSTTPPYSPPRVSMINRYIQYTRQEDEIDKKLEINKARIEEFQTILSGLFKEDARLSKAKLSVGEVKRKTWDNMSNDESRELGIREVRAKRRKAG
ncbi:hypothetical protein C7974DRAFT_414702 [Boeremia exigua]|uniref:uncharacterized protein n=1 Tax=Boeremia exigua TaxID=749465 RepID=UPI001E8CBBC3|nr:uncharacterized protein C7974DRAFT_414702 [Boeremia exigua]KAH6622028.1 hypothetical protein C7974DRAFT_414702 [Boeremia exigua]